MIAYQLSLLPEDRTISFLKNLFSDCPFDINWDLLHCELNLTTDPHIKNVVDLTTSYKALPVNSMSVSNRGLSIVYEPVTETTNLYMPITSQAMEQRAYILRSEFKPLFHPRPFLYLCLCPDYYSSIHHNVYVNSISDVLVRYQDPLFFTLETVRAIDIDGINDQMLYEENGLS